MGGLSREEALERLLLACEASYDVARDYAFEGRTFAGYAELHARASQYVLVKSTKLWQADAHEYLFLEAVEQLDVPAFEGLLGFVTREGLAKVEPVEGHMTSYLSLVVVASSIAADAKALCRHVRFRKNFKWGFRGWADLRVALVDLATDEVVANGQAKEMKEWLEAILLR